MAFRCITRLLARQFPKVRSITEASRAYHASSLQIHLSPVGASALDPRRHYAIMSFTGLTDRALTTFRSSSL